MELFNLHFHLKRDKFAYFVYDSATTNSTVILSDFDRCSGVYSNSLSVPITLNGFCGGVQNFISLTSE